MVGLGGYASAPAAKAAARADVPLILLEQNAVPGKVTRWLAADATLICAAMAEAKTALPPKCPIYVTGNPIYSNRGTSLFRRRDPDALYDGPPRPSLSKKSALATASQRHRTSLSIKPGLDTHDRRRRTLLILGGSGGAQALNENVPHVLAAARAKLDGWQVLHQSGPPGFEATCRLYGRLGIDAEVVPFIDSMAEVLGRADLTISRAGGSTLAELASAGVPALLVPYPLAAADHQRHNAEVYEAAGAAIAIDQRGLGDRLLQMCLTRVVAELLGNTDRRLSMAASMRRLARPHATEDVVGLILEALRGQGCLDSFAKAA